MDGEAEKYEDDDIELLDAMTAPEPEPWQAGYCWEIIVGNVEVPKGVHAAAVHWFIEQLKD